MSRPEPLPAEGGAEGIRLAVFDFDGVFTDNAVWTDAEGNELVRSWRGDGLGIAALRDAGVAVWVVSSEVNPVIGRRCEKLGIPWSQGLSDKAAALRTIARDLKIELQSTLYVGNDVNDRGCLDLVGTPIVVADAHPDVAAAARYRTIASGGFGAVREVCDWVVRSQR